MNWAPAHIPRRELLEVYLTPFAAAIKEARLASIMNAYNEIDGVPLGASKELLTDLLRGELGFDGVVVSDYFTVPTLMNYHRIARDEGDAARWRLEAGIDVELPALQCYGEPLQQALERGTVAMALVDAAVSRVLRMKFQLGLFEQPYVDAAMPRRAVFDTAEQRALAHRIAQKSIVLLKNDGGLLPLAKTVSSIAVIGPSADSIRLLQGDYHYPSHLEMMFGDDQGRRSVATAGGRREPGAALRADGERVGRHQAEARRRRHDSVRPGLRGARHVERWVSRGRRRGARKRHRDRRGG